MATRSEFLIVLVTVSVAILSPIIVATQRYIRKSTVHESPILFVNDIVNCCNKKLVGQGCDFVGRWQVLVGHCAMTDCYLQPCLIRKRARGPYYNGALCMIARAIRFAISLVLIITRALEPTLTDTFTGNVIKKLVHALACSIEL